jgi:hypothetical protein
MANNCMTSLSISNDEEITDEKHDAIIADIRATIEYTGGNECCSSEDTIRYECDTRWEIPTDAIAALAKKHKVKVRAIGREDSCAFVQVVCANAEGIVVQDETIGYFF